jgi:lipopolysaccharide transport system ATP-binding protein
MLGMSRYEVSRHFDGIVSFADIEKFLDTPVKRYSSGMYVRLAFAVAAHLQPEVLIVDEVLAVGDLAFQRRCMTRMQDVGKSGSAVLFVSHNMAAIEALCTRALLLHSGEINRDGDVGDVIGEYHRMNFEQAGMSRFQAAPSHRGAIRSAMLLDESGEVTEYLPLGGKFRLRIGFEVQNRINAPTIGIGIDDTLGTRLLTVHTPANSVVVEQLSGTCQVECEIDPFPLAPGDYWVKLAVSITGKPIDDVERALCFSVVNGEIFSEGRGFHRGLCVAPSTWRHAT